MRKKDILAHGAFGRFSPLTPVLEKARNQRLSILAYHRINDEPSADYRYQEETISATPEMFREQLRFLRRRCHVVNFAELKEILNAGERVPDNTVIITFDDGYRDNLDIALPILQEFGLTAVVYIVTQCIETGEPFWFEALAHDVSQAPSGELRLLDDSFQFTIREDNRRELRRALGDLARVVDDEARLQMLAELHSYCQHISRAESEERIPMNWDEIGALVSAGIEIGSHTVTHPFLSRLTNEQIRCQLLDSKSAIESHTGKAVLSISYPTGSKEYYDDRVTQCAEDCGYEFGVSYEHDSKTFDHHKRFELPRIHVETDVSMPLFKANVLFPEVFLSRETAR